MLGNGLPSKPLILTPFLLVMETLLILNSNSPNQRMVVLAGLRQLLTRPQTLVGGLLPLPPLTLIPFLLVIMMALIKISNLPNILRHIIPLAPSPLPSKTPQLTLALVH